MREISCSEIRELTAKMCIEANIFLPCSLKETIIKASECEKNPLGAEMLKDTVKNFETAESEKIPVCQDCGMTVVFAEIGQEIHITDGNFEDAVNSGIAQGYNNGYLRKSVVSDPLRRINTGTNTPCVLHIKLVEGNKITLTVAPKGFGSENMSAIKMFNPTASKEEIIAFISDTVKKAGAKPCPPVVLGVGIGGDFEMCAYLSKKALCRDISIRNPDKYYESLENEILETVNSLGIGPQGMGGKTTALACNIEYYATHIAGLPIAVNIGCHATRHVTKII